MNVSAPPKFGMGASPRRIEDGSLIRGKGRYTTDVTPAGTLTGYVLRSTVAHARIKVGDLSAARAAPGRASRLDRRRTCRTSASCRSWRTARPTLQFETPPFPVLCADTVRHVGDAIAFIVADDLNSAKSAAELIEVDYETLPAITDTARALDNGCAARLAGARAPTSPSSTTAATRRRPRQASPRPPRSPRLTIVNNRLVCNYMEPRAIVVEPGPRRPLHRDRRLAGRAWPARRHVQGAEGRPESACACSPRTSAAALARRASTTANIRWR